MKVKVN